MSHTPGPWGVSPDGVCIVGPTATYRREVDGAGKEFDHPSELIALPYGCNGGKRDDNARLIAAAPELLAALQDLADRCDGEEGVREDGSNIQTMAARAAIAKATGEPLSQEDSK